MTDTANRKQSGCQTIEQQRAVQAWENIDDLEQYVEGHIEELKRQLEALGAHGNDEERKKLKRKVEEWEHLKGKYGSLVRGLPAMIQVNGLAGTLAFLLAKAGPQDSQDHKEEYYLICHHLAARMNDYFRVTDNDFKLMKWIRESSMDQYRRATAEAIAYANWLKRYVEFKDWKSGEGVE
jgi:CRISPR-associated protein Cmr5